MADWQAAWRTWVGKAAEFSRVKPGAVAATGRNSEEYAALHKSATWWRDAGFDTVYDAIANHCWHDNAVQFHNGKRTEVAA